MSNFNNNDYNNLNENNYGYETNNKKNKKPKKAIAGAVSLAIASSLIGGIAGGTGVYTVLKDRDDVKESVKTSRRFPQERIL